jgi:hypothetical protein
MLEQHKETQVRNTDSHNFFMLGFIGNFMLRKYLVFPEKRIVRQDA